MEKYVDIDGLIRRAGEQLSSQWNSGFVDGLAGFGGLNSDVINGMAASMGPVTIEATVPKVREAVMHVLGLPPVYGGIEGGKISYSTN